MITDISVSRGGKEKGREELNFSTTNSKLKSWSINYHFSGFKLFEELLISHLSLFSRTYICFNRIYFLTLGMCLYVVRWRVHGITATAILR